MEYESDQLAVNLVRVQQLSQSIAMTLTSRKKVDGMPLAIIVQTFEHEIDQLRQKSATRGFLRNGKAFHGYHLNTLHLSLRPRLTTYVVIMNHYTAGLETQLHVAEILLYELGTNEELSAGLAQTQRLELLWKCVKATRSMLEARFRHDARGGGDRPPFICLASFDYAYAMLVCLKLSTLSLPGWDLRLVRSEGIDFERYLLLQIRELEDFTAMRKDPKSPEVVPLLVDERVATAAGPRAGVVGGVMPPPSFEDPFVRLYTRLSQLRVCIVAELAATMPPPPPPPPVVGAAHQLQPRASAEKGDDVLSVVAAAAAADGGGGTNQDVSMKNVVGHGDTEHLLLGDDFHSGGSAVVQGFDDSTFWQELHRPANEWETSFSALLAWGSDDAPYEHWTY